jgi:hypothetical protein
MPNGGYGSAPQGQPVPQQVPQGQPTPPQGPPPQQFQPPSAPRRSPLLAIGVVLAIALGVAALVVSLVKGGGATTPSSAPTTSPTVTATSSAGDTTEADRALCQAIAPLIKESLQDGKDFVNLGHTDTPERDAGIPGYKAKVDAWVDRIQPILDQHSNPPRYLTRMTQQFIDDTRSYADNVRPGEEQEVDRASWYGRLSAFGAAFEICPKFGVTW